MANVEIGRPAELSQIVNILDGGALLPRSRFRGRPQVNCVRPGVVEVEGKSVAERTPQRQCHPMELCETRIHPGRHRTALRREECEAAAHCYALTWDVGTG